MGCPFTNIEEVRHNPLGNAKSGSVGMQAVYKRNQIYEEFLLNNHDMEDALNELDALELDADREHNRKQLLFLDDACKWARQRLAAHRDLLVLLGYDGFLSEVPDVGARVQACASVVLRGSVARLARAEILHRSVASSAAVETKTTSDDVEDGSSYGTMVLPSRSVRIPTLRPWHRPAMVAPWRPYYS